LKRVTVEELIKGLGGLGAVRKGIASLRSKVDKVYLTASKRVKRRTCVVAQLWALKAGRGILRPVLRLALPSCSSQIHCSIYQQECRHHPLPKDYFDRAYVTG
jgi:hypothetical protein